MSDSNWHSASDDPNVRAALKTRRPEDVSLICCQGCGNYGYYNDGSHFTCSWCDWSASGKRLDALLNNGEVITLADYLDADYADEETGVP